MSLFCVSVQEILSYLQTTKFTVEFEGNTELIINGFCSCNIPKSRSITWVKNITENCLKAFSEKEECLIVAKKGSLIEKKSFSYIITEEPKAVFFNILNYFWGDKTTAQLANSAIIKTEKIAQGVSVGEHCFIDEDVSIGEGTIIEPNVTILHHVEIGKNCIIHAGAVIGTDGYGYFADKNGVPEKVKHFGGVVIGDNVEIGANTCIDRGTIDHTFIGNYTKIDNLVHIAHNVQIKENSMLTSGVILSGSVYLEKDSYIAPGGIIKNQKKVGEGAFVGMGAVVMEDVPEYTVVAGIQARGIRKIKKDEKKY